VLGETVFASRPLPSSGTLVIGRGDQCDVSIDEPSVSRRHARLSVGEGMTIEDLGSANGTRVRGRRLAMGEIATVSLREPVEVGSVVVVVHALASAADDAGPEPPPPGSAMAEVHRIVDRIAIGNIAVLVHGETGVGKEHIAERIHRRSPRGDKPLLRLNCAALSESLLESELFGHERGAFSGAAQAKPGLLETAHGGTVLLDEVGELPLAVQAKLLRVIEDKLVLRVGAVAPRPIDVRFVSATNRDLEAEAARGTFRRDLAFRLAGASVFVPPLRERVAEIAPLARRFLERAAREVGRVPPSLSAEAIACLERHEWPGNVRELRNVIERAVLLCEDIVLPAHFPFGRATAPIGDGAPTSAAPSTARSPITLRPSEDQERQRVLEALARCGGNQTRAAKLLGISRNTLAVRLDAFGVARPKKR
jgi:transcriptional regulator with PAS, ATPase and Fis domain